MDFDRLFDQWFSEKEEINAINNVYGNNGLMAVINFVSFLKEKLNVSDINGKNSERNQAYSSGTGFGIR